MFKEIFLEATGRGRSGSSNTQDIEFMIFIGTTMEFRSDNADTIEKKLKNKKFKDSDYKVTRIIDGNKEDVTHLFKN